MVVVSSMSIFPRENFLKILVGVNLVRYMKYIFFLTEIRFKYSHLLLVLSNYVLRTFNPALVFLCNYILEIRRK